MAKIEPMLAAKTTDEDLRRVKFPVLLSPKIDGIRARVQGGVLLSRKFLPIPNPSVQQMFGHRGLEGVDGELVVGRPNDRNLMQQTMAVTRKSGNVIARFFLFDRWNHPGCFHDRFIALEDQYKGNYPGVEVIPHILVSSYDEMIQHEQYFTGKGYEGVMLRSLSGPYKNGRSTVREGYLLKVKRFLDGEARIVGFTERMHNANELGEDAFGRAKRSTAQDNQIPTESLGAFCVEDVSSGVLFDIGTGFTEAQRVNFWNLRESLVGSLVRYKSFAVGVKEKPRFPVFLGFRSDID